MTSRQCDECSSVLPLSATLLDIRTCLLCRVLSRQREQGGRGPRERSPLGQIDPTRKPGTAVVTDQYTREAATKRLVAWAGAHDDQWPVTTDFGRGDALPSINAVRRLWGSLRQMRKMLSRTYPQIRTPTTLPWTTDRVETMVSAWIERHSGEIPVVQHFRTDPTLPVPSVLFTHYGGGLQRFYNEYADGKYAARYATSVAQALQNAGRAGGRSKRAQYQKTV
jgi:hypothetical protein